MDYFAKNLNAIKARYPDLYKTLKRMKPPRDIKIVKTPSGHPTAKWRVNGKWRYLHDPTDPRGTAERFVFEEKRLMNPRLAVFLGFGLGYNVFAFLGHRPPVNQSLIIAEKELAFIWMAFHRFDLTPMLTRQEIHLLFGVKEEYLFLRLMDILSQGTLVRFAKAFEFIETSLSFEANKPYYHSLIKAFKDAIRETLNGIGNAPKDSLIGLDNTLANHRFFIETPGINQLFETFKKVPAIIVATGPSLNKNIEQLKGCEEKALIISVDASLKPLLKHGITPHLVTSLERVPLVKKFFTRIPEDKLRDTYLVAIPLLTPDSLAAYKGEKIVALRSFAHYYWLGIDKGILSIGPSSANMGFTIAEALGCDPIILVGQDLAYAPDGRTHAADNALGEKQEAILPGVIDTFWVKGNYEERVLTTKVWHMFLKNYEDIISGYFGTCINATEGGAYIPGTKVMTLKDTKKAYLSAKTNVLARIRDTLHVPSPEKIHADYEKLIGVVDGGISGLDALIAEYREWRKKVEAFLSREMWRKGEKKKLIEESGRFISELGRVRGELTNHPSYLGIMAHITQSFIIGKEIIFNAVPPYYNPDPIKAQRGIIAEHIDWFQTNVEIMGKTKKLLQRHLRRIRQTAETLKGGEMT